jgi:hypothetical protein
VTEEAEEVAIGSAGATTPRIEQALGWVGAKLDELSGAAVGRVEGVYVDAGDGSPQWLLVRMGRFGHYSLLPLAHAAGGSGHVWVPYDRQAIRTAPRVEAGEPLARELELELCAYFGLPAEGGRAAALAGREPEAATSRLAAGG